MKCVCGSKSIVKETRDQLKGYVRFRQCNECGSRFSTLEVFKAQGEKPEPKQRKPKPLNLGDIWR